MSKATKKQDEDWKNGVTYVMKRVRLDMGDLSQAEMAAKLKVRQQLYQFIEIGRTKSIGMEFASAYKKLTGIDLNKVVKNLGKPIKKDFAEFGDPECRSENELLKEKVAFQEKLIEQLTSTNEVFRRMLDRK